jgi:hypothetical protein
MVGAPKVLNPQERSESIRFLSWDRLVLRRAWRKGRRARFRFWWKVSLQVQFLSPVCHSILLKGVLVSCREGERYKEGER